MYLLKFGGDPHGATSFGELGSDAHKFAILNVGLRIFDVVTDWAFYQVGVRSPAFENVYGFESNVTGITARGPNNIAARYDPKVVTFQTASVIICTSGTFLTGFDIWGSNQRLHNAGFRSAMKVTIAVMLLEDLPQFVMNIVYMDTMTKKASRKVDPVSVLSLVASIINILFAVWVANGDFKKPTKNDAAPPVANPTVPIDAGEVGSFGFATA